MVIIGFLIPKNVVGDTKIVTLDVFMAQYVISNISMAAILKMPQTGRPSQHFCGILF